MNIQEDCRTLAEFHPEAQQRAQLHYTFAHRFLPRYVHENPFNFVLHDHMDPSRYLQVRWDMMEKVLGLRSASLLSGNTLHFRLVTDLSAWAQEVNGFPALFVQMPPAEGSACAHFIAVVLLLPAEQVRPVSRAMERYLADLGPRPTEEMMAPLRAARARYFVLERPVGLEAEQAARAGMFCEWSGVGEHRNFGITVELDRARFHQAVEQTLLKEPPSVAKASVGGSANPARPAKPPPLPPPPGGTRPSPAPSPSTSSDHPAMDPGEAGTDTQLRDMLAKPHFLTDPVFPRDRYLFTLAGGMLHEGLKRTGLAEQIKHLREKFTDGCSSCVMAGPFVAWAFDFEGRSDRGQTGRQEFIERVRNAPKDPAPATDGVTLVEKILARGVFTIQIEDERPPAGSPPLYQICKLKTIGWYVAGLLEPEGWKKSRATKN